MKRVYRDLAPKATECLADLLVEAFGQAGVHLARLERQQVEQHKAIERCFNEALAQIT